MAKSRPERWQAACAAMRAALDDLTEIRDEYQEWLDNMPESQHDGATAEKLQGVVDLDIDGLSSTLEEIETAELPKGFGRD